MRHDEISRWAYFVLLWFIIMGVGVPIIELAVGPALQWLFHDVPYEWPTWNRVGRLALFVVFMGFFAGTLTWFAEKKSSSR